MDCTLIDFDAQAAIVQAGLAQNLFQLAHIFDRLAVFVFAASFSGSNGKKYFFWPLPKVAAGGKQSPPGNKQGGAFQKQASDEARAIQCRIEGNQSSKRGAPEPRIVGATTDAIAALNEWHDFVDQKTRIAFSPRPEDPGIDRAKGQILSHALALRIVDADDDQGRNRFLADKAIGSLIRSPLHAGERGGVVEEILAVVQIKHGIVPLLIFGGMVARRQPHPQTSRVTEDCAGKLMQTQVACYSRVCSRRGLCRTLGNLFCMDFVHGRMASQTRRRELSTKPADVIVINDIRTSDDRHKMHQVASTYFSM
jgi:hypothetical protein